MNLEVSRLQIFSDFYFGVSDNRQLKLKQLQCHTMSSCTSLQAFSALNLTGTLCISQLTVDLNYLSRHSHTRETSDLNGL